VIILIKIKNTLLIYTIGSFTYSLIEILFRGYTHWTMVISGGLVFILLYSVSCKMEQNYYTTQIIIFTLLITTTELFLGMILNKALGLKIWDYSNMPLNFLGQINLFNSLLWLLLSIPSVLICKRLRKIFNKT